MNHLFGSPEEILNRHITGFHQYLLEAPIHLTYASQNLCDMLGGSPEELLTEYTDGYGSYVHPADRQIYADFLGQLSEKEQTVTANYRIIRKDGEVHQVRDTAVSRRWEDGRMTADSVLTDITEKSGSGSDGAIRQYLNALTEVYDILFEYDFAKQTVKCISGQKSDRFRPIQNIPMHLEQATEQWIETNVCGEDRARVLGFFADYYQQIAGGVESLPPQIQYRALSSSGETKTYAGIFLKVHATLSLFCCRSIQNDQETHALISENQSLKRMNENMQELVKHFTDGVVAFEVEDGFVKPLYASDNVCHFFGYTREEWVHYVRERHSIQEFVSHSDVAYEEFMELLENGEAEFEYMDQQTGKPQRIKAVCSHMFADSSRQYVMLYHINGHLSGKVEAEQEAPRVYIRTFGYFDVFVDDKPIAFRNEKAKELFALLVDRRGGYVASEEAISFLWEDETANPVTFARYRKVALRLKNILEEYGISEIVESVNGRRRIVMNRVRCDLYDYLSRKEEYAQLFKGSYLTNYSWGENTLGELLGEHTN